MGENFDLSDHQIDVTTVQRNIAPAKLYEEALRHEQGSTISDQGALVVSSGAKTGRSPGDKRIVENPKSQENHLKTNLDAAKAMVDTIHWDLEHHG